MNLADVWFILIAVLWTGYFFLEGFDFGVGMLLPILGRTEVRRRVLINSIGPVWDGNEVWLLTAGGATFAAFPLWYATLFSGFYLPLLLILVALIVRVVAFDYRGKESKLDGKTWRSRWDMCLIFGSYAPSLLWGVAFANILRGVKLNAEHDYVGSVFDLLNPYALLGGVVFVVVFMFHGAVYTALKTDGDIRVDATSLAVKVGLVAAVVAVPFLLWTQSLRGNSMSAVLFVVAALGVVAAIILIREHRDGWAFICTGAAIAAVVAGMFWGLYPDVMPALDPANSLNVTNASSSHYTLTVMTWVAAIFTPVVVGYQAWTYWVFRKRIGVQHIPMSPEHESAHTH